MSNLQLRLATAAVGLPLVLGVTWIGGWAFALVVAGIGLLAAAEFVHGWLLPSMPIRNWPRPSAPSHWAGSGAM